MKNNDYNFVDHSGEVKEEFLKAAKRAMVKCGLLAERYAKQAITAIRAVDTGYLRNSITWAVDGESANQASYKASKGGKSGSYSGKAPAEHGLNKAVFVGSNVEYAPYVELGTGIHTSGGRPDAWVYQDAEGKWHRTHGMKARPFLKPAIADHLSEYKKIIEDEMEGE